LGYSNASEDALCGKIVNFARTFSHLRLPSIHVNNSIFGNGEREQLWLNVVSCVATGQLDVHDNL
jgi:hypothetical protein